MARPEEGLAAGDKLRHVLANELLWQLGEAAPAREPGTPGAPRHYPEWVWFLFDTSVSLYLSARKAAAELAAAWPEVIAASKDRYPERPELWAPAKPPARHHWQYAKLRMREGPNLRASIELFEQVSAVQAVEMGICDADGGGSISHPHPYRAITGDGKVITPMYKAKRRTQRVDRETGEILGIKKADPTAIQHVTGGGRRVVGNKVVMVAGRTVDWHGRMILGLDRVPTKGGEAQVAIDCVKRVKANLPGAQALVYDGALRGTHIRYLLHDVGILPISPPTAEEAETPDKARKEKIAYIETVSLNGTDVALYALGSQIGVGEYDANGDETFTPLKRLAIKRRPNLDGTYRWYGLYQVPAHLGGGEILVRADTTTEDDGRNVNRSENFRLIPPGDPDYEDLYGLRSDIEANNRQLEDTLWINRAHSNGAEAQLLDLLGYALLYNSIAIGLARARAMAPAGVTDAAA